MLEGIYKQRVDRLKALIDAAGGTASFIRTHANPAADIPLSEAYLSQILNGYRRITEKAARLIALRAGLPEMTLLEDPNVHFLRRRSDDNRRIMHQVLLLTPAQVAEYFIKDNTCKDTEVLLLSLPAAQIGLETVETSMPVNDHTFAMQIEGDSMLPRFSSQTRVIVEPDLAPQDGNMVVAFQNGAVTCKQLVRDGLEYFLKPVNPQYLTRPVLLSQVIGVVIESTTIEN